MSVTLAILTPPQAHQACELLAYAAAGTLYFFLRRRWPRHLAGGGGPPTTFHQTLWILVGAIFGALIGARGLALVEHFSSTLANLHDPRALLEGKTIVGAILGGWVGVETAKRFLRISHPSGDIYVFPLILGMCIGRVGCFIAGGVEKTYGLHSSLPWAVDFGDGPRHPAQLYEIAFLLLVAGVFAWRLATRRQKGCMFSQFVFTYLAWRFFIEFIKERELIPYLHLSAIQTASLAGMVYARFHWFDQCCNTPSQKAPASSAPSTDGLIELTNSLCPQCLQSQDWTLATGHSPKVEAKVIAENNRIYLQKFCPTHGRQKVLIAHDAAYWHRARRTTKPPTPPLRRNTDLRRGCPFDCGLCPDHEQHSCLAIVEITDQCNLRCPVCYAASAPAGQHRSLAQITSMIDAVVANEAHVNVLQISGGEPTLHPDFFAILDAARQRPIRHLMLNTNGQRIADDPAFTQRLAAYMPGFEVYLQFDSLRTATLAKLRGEDLSDLRRRALAALNQHNISTTLVVTVAKGLNDSELGEIIDFATTQPCVRGVTFQPIQCAGRLDNANPETDRLTLSEVRANILAQHPLFKDHDLLPVPCHADALAMAYAIRHTDHLTPLSQYIDPQALLALAGNTIAYEQDPALRENFHRLFSAGASPASAATTLAAFCCAPLALARLGPLTYNNIFRIIIMAFMDAHSMDLRSVKRSCVHIVHPDGRLIPFDTYNVLYRNAPVTAKA